MFERPTRILVNDSNALDIDVSGDGSCLFYSIAFSVLIPLLNDEDKFTKAFITLFGEEQDQHRNEVRELLKIYDGSKNFILRDDAEILRVLIDIEFRHRIVDHMEKYPNVSVNGDEKAGYASFTDENGQSFQKQMNSMRKQRVAGGDREIRAASELLAHLKINIFVHNYDAQGEDYVYSYPANSAKTESTIQLIHDINSNRSEYANHYRYFLNKKYRDFCLLRNMLKAYEVRNNESEHITSLQFQLNAYITICHDESSNSKDATTNFYAYVLQQINTTDSDDFRSVLFHMLSLLAKQLTHNQRLIDNIERSIDTLENWLGRGHKKPEEDHVYAFNAILPRDSQMAPTHRLKPSQHTPVASKPVENIAPIHVNHTLPTIPQPSLPESKSSVTNVIDMETRKKLGEKIVKSLSRLCEQHNLSETDTISITIKNLLLTTQSYYSGLFVTHITRNKLLETFQTALAQAVNNSTLESVLGKIDVLKVLNRVIPYEKEIQFNECLEMIIAGIQQNNPELICIPASSRQSSTSSQLTNSLESSGSSGSSESSISATKQYRELKMLTIPEYDEDDTDIMSSEEIRARLEVLNLNQKLLLNRSLPEAVRAAIQNIGCDCDYYPDERENKRLQAIRTHLLHLPASVKSDKDYRDLGLAVHHPEKKMDVKKLHGIYETLKKKELHLRETFNSTDEITRYTGSTYVEKLVEEIKYSIKAREKIKAVLLPYNKGSHKQIKGIGKTCAALSTSILWPEKNARNQIAENIEIREQYSQHMVASERDSYRQGELIAANALFGEITAYVTKRRASFFSWIYNDDRDEQIKYIFGNVSRFIDGQDNLQTLKKALNKVATEIENEFIIRSPENSDLYCIIQKALKNFNSIQTLKNKDAPKQANNASSIANQPEKFSDSERRTLKDQATVARETTLKQFVTGLQAAKKIGKPIVTEKIETDQENLITAIKCINKAKLNSEQTLRYQMTDELVKVINDCNEDELEKILQTDLILKLDNILTDNDIDHSSRITCKNIIRQTIQNRLKDLVEDLLIQDNSRIDDNDITYDERLNDMCYHKEFSNLNRVAIRINKLPFIKNCIENDKSNPSSIKATLNTILEAEGKKLFLKECRLLLSNDTNEVNQFNFKSFEMIISHSKSPLSLVTINGVNKYDLCLMSNTEPKQGELQIKCQPEGLVYKVLGMKNEQLIPWVNLPASFPRGFVSIEEIYIFLPDILGITITNGHTYSGHPYHADAEIKSTIDQVRKRYFTLLSLSTDTEQLTNFILHRAVDNMTDVEQVLKNIDAAAISDSEIDNTSLDSKNDLQAVRDRHIYLMLSSGDYTSDQILQVLKMYDEQTNVSSVRHIFDYALDDFCMFHNDRPYADALKRTKGLTTHALLYAADPRHDLQAIINKVESLLNFYVANYKSKDEYNINGTAIIKNFLTTYFLFLMNMNNTKLVELEIAKYKDKGFTSIINSLQISDNDTLNIQFTEILEKSAEVDNDIITLLANHLVLINNQLDKTLISDLDELFVSKHETLYKHSEFIINGKLRNQITEKVNRNLLENNKKISDKWSKLFYQNLYLMLESVPSNNTAENLLGFRLQIMAHIFCSPMEQNFLIESMQKRNALFNYLSDASAPEAMPKTTLSEDENASIRRRLTSALKKFICPIIINNDAQELSRLLNLPDNASAGFYQPICMTLVYNIILENKNKTSIATYSALAMHPEFVNFIANHANIIDPDFIHRLYQQGNEKTKLILLHKAIVDLNTRLINNSSADYHDDIFKNYEWIFTVDYQAQCLNTHAQVWDAYFEIEYTRFLEAKSPQAQAPTKERLDFITHVYCSPQNKMRYVQTLQSNHAIDEFLATPLVNGDLNQFIASLSESLRHCDQMHKESIEAAFVNFFQTAETIYTQICDSYHSLAEASESPKLQCDAVFIKNLENYIRMYLAFNEYKLIQRLPVIHNFLSRIDKTTKEEIIPHLYCNSKFFSGTTQTGSQNNLSEPKRKINETYLLLHCVAFQSGHIASPDLDIVHGLKCVRSAYIAHGTTGVSSETETDKFRYDALEQFTPYSDLFPICFLGYHVFTTNSRHSKADSNFRIACRKEYAKESLVVRLVLRYYSLLQEIKVKLSHMENSEALLKLNADYNSSAIKHALNITNTSLVRDAKLAELLSDSIASYPVEIKNNPMFAASFKYLSTQLTFAQSALKHSINIQSGIEANAPASSLVKQYYILELLTSTNSTIEHSRRMQLAHAELISLIEIGEKIDPAILQEISSTLGLEIYSADANVIVSQLVTCMKDKENIDKTLHTIKKLNMTKLITDFQFSLEEYLAGQHPANNETHIDELRNSIVIGNTRNLPSRMELLPDNLRIQLENIAVKTYTDPNVQKKYVVCALLYAQLHIMIDSLKEPNENSLQYSLRAMSFCMILRELIENQLAYLQKNEVEYRNFGTMLNGYISQCIEKFSNLDNCQVNDGSPFTLDLTLIKLDYCILQLKDFSEGVYSFDALLFLFNKCVSIDWDTYTPQQQNFLLKSCHRLFDILQDEGYDQDEIAHIKFVLFGKYISETQITLLAKFDRSYFFASLPSFLSAPKNIEPCVNALKLLLPLTTRELNTIEISMREKSDTSKLLRVISAVDNQYFYSLLPNLKTVKDLNLFFEIAQKIIPCINQKAIDSIPLELLQDADKDTLLNFCDLVTIANKNQVAIKLSQQITGCLISASDKIYFGPCEQKNVFINDLWAHNNKTSLFLIEYVYIIITNKKNIADKVSSIVRLIEDDKYFLSATKCIDVLKSLPANERCKLISSGFRKKIGGFGRTDKTVAKIIMHEINYFVDLMAQADLVQQSKFKEVLHILSSRFSACTFSVEQQTEVCALKEKLKVVLSSESNSENDSDEEFNFPGVKLTS